MSSWALWKQRSENNCNLEIRKQLSETYRLPLMSWVAGKQYSSPCMRRDGIPVYPTEQLVSFPLSDYYYEYSL